MSGISTHILNISHGKPAQGVRVLLENMESENQWIEVGNGITDNDGRIKQLLDNITTNSIYRITIDTDSYFRNLDIETFYPSVTITFKVKAGEHYHVPLLLSPFGYSTYRGS